jgi:HEXXH motif-containing protein
MMEDISFAPVPRTGIDRLPGLLIHRAKYSLSQQLATCSQQLPNPHLDQITNAQEAMERLPSDVLGKILLHPLFSKWVARDDKTTDITFLDLNRMLLSSLIAEQAFPAGRGLLVPLTEGQLRGPGLRPTRITSTSHAPLARVSADDDRVRLETGMAREDVMAGQLLHPGVRPLPEADLVVDAGDPVFGRFLDRMNAVPGVIKDAHRDLRPVTEPGSDLLDTYRTAVNQLKECWPEAADELLRYVRVIVPFKSPFMLGWATPLFQGAVFVRAAPGDLLFTFERLVHEAAHLRLFAIQRTAGRLHSDPPEKRLPSPARADPRPVIGVYHAAFVYARLSEAFARAVNHGADETWARRLDALLGKYQTLSKTLHTHATLTPLGEQILARLDERTGHLFGSASQPGSTGHLR